MQKITLTLMLSALAFAQSCAAATAGFATPEQWNTSPANPTNTEVANFAGNYAAKALTVVTRFEKTEKGQLVYVVVGGKACTVEVIERDRKPYTNYLTCEK